MTSVWLTDWTAYGDAAHELNRSTSAIMRAIGFTALGVATPFADADTTHVERARLELVAPSATSDEVFHEYLTGLIQWVEGRVAAGRGDVQAGLDGCAAFLGTCRSIDFYTTTTPRAAKHAATCQVLLGDPASAIDTVAWLEDFDRSTFRADDIRALALLAHGQFPDARPLVRAHAKRD
jgi:hypothetical protein